LGISFLCPTRGKTICHGDNQRKFEGVSKRHQGLKENHNEMKSIQDAIRENRKIGMETDTRRTGEENGF
jgi:hypothetical protein